MLIVIQILENKSGNNIYLNYKILIVVCLSVCSTDFE